MGCERGWGRARAGRPSAAAARAGGPCGGDGELLQSADAGHHRPRRVQLRLRLAHHRRPGHPGADRPAACALVPAPNQRARRLFQPAACSRTRTPSPVRRAPQQHGGHCGKGHGGKRPERRAAGGRQAVYTVLREAEYRSTYPVPYWNLAPLRWAVPRQRRCTAALAVVNQALDALISKCKRLVRRPARPGAARASGGALRSPRARPSSAAACPPGRAACRACTGGWLCRRAPAPRAQVEEEDAEFVDEFLSAADPSILHFLLASGEQARRPPPPRAPRLRARLCRACRPVRAALAAADARACLPWCTVPARGRAAVQLRAPARQASELS